MYKKNSIGHFGEKETRFRRASEKIQPAEPRPVGIQIWTNWFLNKLFWFGFGSEIQTLNRRERELFKVVSKGLLDGLLGGPFGRPFGWPSDEKQKKTKESFGSWWLFLNWDKNWEKKQKTNKWIWKKKAKRWALNRFTGQVNQRTIVFWSEFGFVALVWLHKRTREKNPIQKTRLERLRTSRPDSRPSADLNCTFRDSNLQEKSGTVSRTNRWLSCQRA